MQTSLFTTEEMELINSTMQSVRIMEFTQEQFITQLEASMVFHQDQNVKALCMDIQDKVRQLDETAWEELKFGIPFALHIPDEDDDVAAVPEDAYDEDELEILTLNSTDGEIQCRILVDFSFDGQAYMVVSVNEGGAGEERPATIFRYTMEEDGTTITLHEIMDKQEFKRAYRVLDAIMEDTEQALEQALGRE